MLVNMGWTCTHVLQHLTEKHAIKRPQRSNYEATAKTVSIQHESVLCLGFWQLLWNSSVVSKTEESLLFPSARHTRQANKCNLTHHRWAKGTLRTSQAKTRATTHCRINVLLLGGPKGAAQHRETRAWLCSNQAACCISLASHAR